MVVLYYYYVYRNFKEAMSRFAFPSNPADAGNRTYSATLGGEVSLNLKFTRLSFMIIIMLSSFTMKQTKSAAPVKLLMIDDVSNACYWSLCLVAEDAFDKLASFFFLKVL
jgi:hypothetical protein